ncbi:MAG TPA: ankyrin repeat domain-containing protein [Vicinamibacterales bacterium]|nr:ankyrin repeat domain-containing protein [Vicinamibacterales bacterium]
MNNTKLLAVVLSAALSTSIAASGPSDIANAAQAKNAAAVKKLLKDGADVNAAQGDGMTALHWAALNGDAELASMLLYAGANVGAKTRIGGYTPLHLAAQVGAANVIAPLVAAGAAVSATTATGTTPLMQAAHSGNTDAVRMLIENGADPNVTETANGQSALMFAAAADRVDVVKLLLSRGADIKATSRVQDFSALTMSSEVDQNGVPRQAQPNQRGDVPGVTRPFNYNELIGKHGGLSALHFAARQGAMATADALLAAGADVNQRCAGDQTTPLIVAAVNGHFDLVSFLLDKGANPNLVSEAGMFPLYAVINTQWQPRSFYPQPRAYLQQKTDYLTVMKKLLDKGADPNARIYRKPWFTEYNFELLRTDDSGATAFWRAAWGADIAAMKLLVEYGADPNIRTMKIASRQFGQGGTRGGSDQDPLGRAPMPTGGPGATPLIAVAGTGYSEGFAGNAHRYAPTGLLAAVKYLVEELGADVNAEDEDGNTAVHNAASRGDNEMIQYLVSKGADVKKVNRRGQTTVDMANGPVQRTQPYPETIKLLESLGAKNNHRCVSC